MTEPIDVVEAVTGEKAESPFVKHHDDAEFIEAMTLGIFGQLEDEIAQYSNAVEFGQDAIDGMKAEVEEYGENYHPPVAKCILEMGIAQLDRDKAWLAKLQEVKAKYYPVETANHDL